MHSNAFAPENAAMLLIDYGNPRAPTKKAHASLAAPGRSRCAGLVANATHRQAVRHARD